MIGPTASRIDADWLDDVLRAEGREHRASYMDDDGFTARVMSALPAPVTLPAWRRPMLIALWATAGIAVAFALPAPVFDFVHDALRVLHGQRISLAGVGAGVAGLAAATWAAAAVALRYD